MILARVVEILFDRYSLVRLDNNEKIYAVLKGTLKKNINILVGDFVELEKNYDKYVITKIKERKNFFIRPPVSNIDSLVIVLSISNPSLDYMLLDKQLVLCMSKNIIPIICINKIDLANDNIKLNNEIDYIKNIYSKIFPLQFISVHDNIGIYGLLSNLHGKVVAFSGNSGVGKSSLTKKILSITNCNENIQDIEIGDISVKNSKGKNTTKSVKLFDVGNNTYILDTPGFSSFELYGINYKKLKDYYPEFLNLKCEYDDCMHVNEDSSVCSVKRHVENGLIDKLRYERYVYIYNKLKELEDKRYKR